jgi:hypothetical protein
MGESLQCDYPATVREGSAMDPPKHSPGLQESLGAPWAELGALAWLL